MVSVAAFSLMVGACNSKQNNGDNSESSTEVAEDVNKDLAGLSNRDAEFVSEAASGGMLEVEAGKLALQKSANDSVKMFAQMMVTDHTKANDRLKALATENKWQVPATMSDDHMKKLSDLKEKSGMDFEDAYTDLMEKDHKEDVDKFEAQADKGDNAALKQFASETLPTLRMHKEHAMRMQQMVNEMKKKNK